MRAVAVLVHDMTDEYFSEIARGIEDEAYAHGYVTLICNTDRDPAKEVQYLRKLRSMRVDVVIFAAGEFRDPGHRADITRQLTAIEESGGVVVHLAPVTDGRPDVAFSNATGFRLAVDHLVDLGHVDIAYLTGPRGNATSLERLDAVRTALRRHGIALPFGSVFDANFSRPGGITAANRFLDAGCPATAVVGSNDQSAIGFMQRLRERGVKVPDEVSVVGFDDISSCAFVEPPLTTVHVPLHELGVRGMTAALSMLDGADRTPTRELAVHLITRGSTAPPRSTNRPA